jgi:SAM-dependent methyltransferase
MVCTENIIIFIVVYCKLNMCWRETFVVDLCVYLCACARVLKPGGVYLLVCVSRPHLHLILFWEV